MGDLSDVITVVIKREASPVTAASFKLPLILGEKSNKYSEGYGDNPKRYAEYSRPADLADDGFDPKGAIYAAATALLSGPNPLARFAVAYWDEGSETLTEALDTIVRNNPGWYALVCTSRTAAEQMEIATWAEAEKKLFIAATADPKALIKDDDGSIAKLVADAGLEHTAVIYNGGAKQADATKPAGWADAAWVGLMLGKAPGSATWAYKTLTGIVPDDSLSANDRAVLESKHANYYDTVAGARGTRYGTVGSGEYIDIIVGVDWLRTRLQERIFGRLASLDKVPYTDAGINTIKGDVYAILDLAVRRNVLDRIVYVTAPKAAEVEEAKKKQRLLPDVRFRATLAGAVHKVAVEGIVSL